MIISDTKYALGTYCIIFISIIVAFKKDLQKLTSKYSKTASSTQPT